MVNSFSKTWAMTGWRIGWMVLPAALTHVVDKLIEFNTSGGQPFLQRRLRRRPARQGEPFVAEMVERYRAGRDLVLQRLGGMRRVEIVRPERRFYVMFGVEGMSDSLAFAKKLVHGGARRPRARQRLRPRRRGPSAPLLRRQPDRLSQAMDRLEPFLN